jgi:hypothetical protein
LVLNTKRPVTGAATGVVPLLTAASETLGMRIFPRGVFSEKDLKSVWDNQKVEHNGMESDNLVDYNVAGLSIQFLN